MVKAEVDKNFEAECLGLITALDDVETERPVSRKQTVTAQRILLKDGLQCVRSYPSVTYGERQVYSESGHCEHLSCCNDFCTNSSQFWQAIGGFSYGKPNSSVLFADPLTFHLLTKIRRPPLLPHLEDTKRFGDFEVLRMRCETPVSEYNALRKKVICIRED